MILSLQRFVRRFGLESTKPLRRRRKGVFRRRQLGAAMADEPGRDLMFCGEAHAAPGLQEPGNAIQQRALGVRVGQEEFS
jgi:hypothetical protein